MARKTNSTSSLANRHQDDAKRIDEMWDTFHILGSHYCPDSDTPATDFLEALSHKFPTESQTLSSLPDIPMHDGISLPQTPKMIYGNLSRQIAYEIRLCKGNKNVRAYQELAVLADLMKMGIDEGVKNIDDIIACAIALEEKEIIFGASISFAAFVGRVSYARRGKIPYISNVSLTEAKKKQIHRERIHRELNSVMLIWKLACRLHLSGARHMADTMAQRTVLPICPIFKSRIRKHVDRFIAEQPLEEWARFYEFLMLICSHCEETNFSLKAGDYIDAGIAEEYQALVAGVPFRDIIGKQ